MNYYRRTVLVALCAVSRAGSPQLRNINCSLSRVRLTQTLQTPGLPRGSAQTTRRQWMLEKNSNQSNGLAASHAPSAHPRLTPAIDLLRSSLLLHHCPLHDPLLLRHRPIAEDVVTDIRLDVLHVAPAILAAILQPKNTRSRVWRLPVPANCELVETALNPVIGRLLSRL